MNRRTLLGLFGATSLAGFAGPALAHDHHDHDNGHGHDHHDEMGHGLVTIERDDEFDEAVDEIEAAIEERDLNLVLSLDHAEDAAEVGEELPPTTLLVFGDPEIGTEFMQDERTVGIDLPMKLLVWEDENVVNVSYNRPMFLARRHGIEGREDQLEMIDGVLESLATAGTDEDT